MVFLPADIPVENYGNYIEAELNSLSEDELANRIEDAFNETQIDWSYKN